MVVVGNTKLDPLTCRRPSVRASGESVDRAVRLGGVPPAGATGRRRRHGAVRLALAGARRACRHALGREPQHGARRLEAALPRQRRTDQSDARHPTAAGDGQPEPGEPRHRQPLRHGLHGEWRCCTAAYIW